MAATPSRGRQAGAGPRESAGCARSAEKDAAISEPAHGLEELLRENFQPGIGELLLGRPSSDAGFNRPNLLHAATNPRIELPSAQNVPYAAGTHDVNDEMLAEAYRCGLRIRGLRHFACESLEFLFGP